MSGKNRVVWTEGLFLRPQHFQQHDRFIERQLHLRAGSLRSHGWGFSELEIDRELLKVGKIGISRAQGVFPDGMPFSIPDDDPVPPALEVDRTARDLGVFLAVPLQKNGATEVVRGANGVGEARLTVSEVEVRDASPDSSENAKVEVASANTRLLMGDSLGSDRSAIPLARVVQVRSDGLVELADGFMPTVLSVRAAPVLDSFLTELMGMLRQRGDHLASIAVASTRGQASDLREFLLLQAINRWEPLITHIHNESYYHPEELFQVCLQMLGDLAALSFDSRRPGPPPPYVHEDLQATFSPLIASIRAALGSPMESRTVAIPLEDKGYGVRLGAVGDRRRFEDSEFILAVSAEESQDTLARSVPALVTISASERIAQLVNGQQPGVALSQLPPPREIPVHRGFLYFRLDDQHSEWAALKTSAGIAIHVPESIPGVQLELWTIRR